MRSELVKPVALIGLAVITVVVSPLLALMFAWDVARRLHLRARWHLKHGRHGRHWLAVYSDGAKWKEHFESAVLPAFGHSAVVVNCSTSPNWHHKRSLERQVHAYWAGPKAHTPIVIRLSRLPLAVTCVPFYEAYMAQAKRGDTTELLRRVQEVCALAGEA